MPHASLRLQDVEVTPLCDGWAPLPLADECPGGIVDWPSERRRFPWAFVDEESWAWHVHAFLIKMPNGPVLIDTGIGTFGTDIYDVTGRLDVELERSGVRPDDVRHVVHTHLHADHAGGTMTPDGEPRFANATHHVHPADWVFFDGADDPEDFNGRAAMAPLLSAGMLDLSAEDREITPGIRLVHSPGHTPGHRSVVLSAGDDHVLFTGDLLHVTPQVAHPDWASSHDEDPAQGCSSRVRLLRTAHDDGWFVAVSHFGEPFGRIGVDGWVCDDLTRA